MIKYLYDANGMIKNVTGNYTIAYRNPFRYKGYYYDSESGMYYCKSSYYVPYGCRWLNGASARDINPKDSRGINLFSYCSNNPIMYYDPNGCWFVNIGTEFRRLAMKIMKEKHYERLEKKGEFPENLEKEYITSQIEKYLAYLKEKNNHNYEISNGPLTGYIFEDARCHQFDTKGENYKILSPDGHYEFIFDAKGNLIEDPRNIGTYNYFPPNQNEILHGVVDVFPWLLWGNSPDDNTNFFQRLNKVFGK